MNKNEKELAAIYISACLDEMRIADKYNNPEAKERAVNDYKKYCGKIRELLLTKYELFGLDYNKAVQKPIDEISRLAGIFYSKRVNGEPLEI